MVRDGAEWLDIDDDEVREVSSEDVLDAASTCYILAYRLISED